MMKLIMMIAGTAVCKCAAFSFPLSTPTTTTTTRCHTGRIAITKHGMVGGRGWGNDDFLSSLGGSDEERDEEQQKYNDFKEAREAFDERQQERMNSPAGQKFMQDMMQRQGQAQVQTDANLDSDGGFFADMGFGGEDMSAGGREGGSRFANMMNQANARMQGRAGMPGNAGLGGFEQKLAIPLDDDEDDEGAFN